MIERFKQVQAQVAGHFEFRFHRMELRNLTVVNGVVQKVSDTTHEGVGIRCVADGGVGYSSTASTDLVDILAAARRAREVARAMAGTTARQAEVPFRVARGESRVPDDPGEAPPLAERLEVAASLCGRLQAASSYLESAYVALNDQWHERWVYTSDGAEAYEERRGLSLYLNAHARRAGDLVRSVDVVRSTGRWSDFAAGLEMQGWPLAVARSAVAKLNAAVPESGPQTVVLGPRVVGTLIHEAVGHPVEADFVLAGSAAAGKLGKQVASDLVTVVDFAGPGPVPSAPTALDVDDEGIAARDAVLIENGLLTGYLHNRETAKRFGAEPSGNARAFRYVDEPLIRMRNTAMLPGRQPLRDLFHGIEHGYYLTRIYNGEADVNGEFMFSVLEGYEIRDGQIGRPLRDHIITGQAWEVLHSIDAVSDDFEWLGGVCGKGQLAVVGMGGPHVRCRVMIGGK